MWAVTKPQGPQGLPQGTSWLSTCPILSQTTSCHASSHPHWLLCPQVFTEKTRTTAGTSNCLLSPGPSLYLHRGGTALSGTALSPPSELTPAAPLFCTVLASVQHHDPTAPAGFWPLSPSSTHQHFTGLLSPSPSPYCLPPLDRSPPPATPSSFPSPGTGVCASSHNKLCRRRLLQSRISATSVRQQPPKLLHVSSRRARTPLCGHRNGTSRDHASSC